MTAYEAEHWHDFATAFAAAEGALPGLAFLLLVEIKR
jgi:hypothetical protein